MLQGTVWDINSKLPLAAEDISASGATTADYQYGPGGNLQSMATAAGTFYPSVDWLGSVTGLTNSSGTQVTATTYAPYGTASTTNLAAGAPQAGIGYAGSYTLPGGTGLDNMRARDYSPATGSFTSVDPMLASTGQPYAYAGDAPASSADPSGLINDVPSGGGGSLTIDEILQDPYLLGGMNPDDLLSALGGTPSGFEISPGRGRSVAPGWKLLGNYGNRGAVSIRWSAGSLRPGHSRSPYWKVSTGGKNGGIEEVPAGAWPDGPGEYTGSGGACTAAYTGFGCGTDDPLLGGGDEGNGEDPFFGDEFPGLLSALAGGCPYQGGII